MFYNDHNPPHFHAKYGEHEVRVELGSLSILEGKLPPRAEAMVMDWAAIHIDELNREWDLAKAHKPLFQIEPLP